MMFRKISDLLALNALFSGKSPFEGTDMRHKSGYQALTD
jgi:hypothetical protein